MRYSLLILSVDWGVGMACLMPTLFWYVTLAAAPPRSRSLCPGRGTLVHGLVYWAVFL